MGNSNHEIKMRLRERSVPLEGVCVPDQLEPLIVFWRDDVRDQAVCRAFSRS